MISYRTKKALAEKKKQSFTLDRPENLTPVAIESGRQVRQLNARADENNWLAAALPNSTRASCQTWAAITTALNRAGFHTGRGKVRGAGPCRG